MDQHVVNEQYQESKEKKEPNIISVMSTRIAQSSTSHPQTSPSSHKHKHQIARPYARLTGNRCHTALLGSAHVYMKSFRGCGHSV